jgi:hypothetical protein
MALCALASVGDLEIAAPSAPQLPLDFSPESRYHCRRMVSHVILGSSGG